MIAIACHYETTNTTTGYDAGNYVTSGTGETLTSISVTALKIYWTDYHYTDYYCSNDIDTWAIICERKHKIKKAQQVYNYMWKPVPVPNKKPFLLKQRPYNRQLRCNRKGIGLRMRDSK